MNKFEEIVKQEKLVSYVQRDRQLFGFYTMVLIAQEQAAKKVKIKLWALLIVLTVFASLFLSSINQSIVFLVGHLNTIDITDIFIMALISYGVAGLYLLLIRRGAIVSR
jgi:hypothetical protein